tara:strand:+ start:101 stop:850 length:750 start_codon:yes stop_codon:yes gene_type:complete
VCIPFWPFASPSYVIIAGTVLGGQVNPLSGLGRCSQCGGSILYETQRQHRYGYCYNQATYPKEHQCFKPKRWNLDLLEQQIWAKIDWILDEYRNFTYDLLLEKYESGKGDRELRITKVKSEIEKSKSERQVVLRQVRRGNISQADADIEFAVIDKDEIDLQQELDNLKALNVESGLAIDTFMEHLKAVNTSFDYGFNPTNEQKKEILNLLLDKFTLYPDGYTELQFRMPVNKHQVAEFIHELTCNVLVK